MAAITEDALLKGLSDLEVEIAKGGDALQNQPHDGGFATEGTNIQAKAKAIQKAYANLGEELSIEKATKMAKMLSATDMEGDDDGEGDGEGEMSYDDKDEGKEEDEEEEGDVEEKSVKKSNAGADKLAAASGDDGDEFRKALSDDHPGVDDMLDVSEFLQGLTDTVAKSYGASASSIDDLAKALVHSDARAQSFDRKIAKAVVSIGNELRQQGELLKSVLAQPMTPQRRGVLHKADVVHPPFQENGPNGGDGDPLNTPLMNVPYLKVQEALVKACTEDKTIDLLLVTKFENAKGDFRVLPPAIIKSLEAILCPQH